MKEDQIQMTFKTWCDKQDKILLHWHVPNGFTSNAVNCSYMKRLGLTVGIPDYWILLSNCKLLVIEFKTTTGKVSEQQEHCLNILTQCHIPNKVCRSAHEATLFVKENW